MSSEYFTNLIKSVENQLKNTSKRDCIRATRWLIGLLLLGIGMTLLIQGSFLGVIKGTLFIVISLACLIRKFSTYLSRCYKNVRRAIRVKKAGVSYRYVDQLINDGEYQEAEQELYWIVENFPEEVRPHIDLVWLALNYHKDQNIADMRMLHALRTFKKDEDQEKLKRAYNKLSPRNKEHISFKKEQPASSRPKLKTFKKI